jgi:thiosulfate/3-mercaptopyruvate sulfurtransferase
MMKKVLVATIALVALSMMIAQAGSCFNGFMWCPRIVPAIVSTNWLNWNLNRINLIVLDVRSPDAYNAGHIPGAINVVESNWYINDPFTVPFDIPWMEMPPDAELIALIGGAGIQYNSIVVVVGSTSGLLLPELPLALYSTAGITRVAMTLLYGGVRNVAVLDGGYEKWVIDGKPTSTDPVTPTPVAYVGKIDKNMVVSLAYVDSKIGKSTIVDARDEVVYNCIVQEPWATQPGHIPTAKNLPTPSLWNIHVDDQGNAAYITYKDFCTLNSMVSSKIGWNRFKEIIIYCGVGGYESTAHFVISEFLGYLNVKMYDGSAQEWTHAGMPVECP